MVKPADQAGVQVAALVAPGCMVTGPIGARIIQAALDRVARMDGIPLTAAALHLRTVAAEAADVTADAAEREPGHADMPTPQDPAQSTAWITTADAARRAGVHERTVRRWAEAKRLGSSRVVRGTRRIDVLALDAYMAERELD